MPALRVVGDAAVGLRHELAEMRLGGERGARCATASLAVALATTVALAVHVEETWWAAISGFMCSQATAPASLQKGVLRIVGTLGGAGLALLLSPWLKQDAIGLSLALFAVSITGVVGLLVSEHGYAWLLGAITADMVLMALLSDPGSAIDVAASRTGEVIVGTLSAMLVAVLVGSGAAATPAAPAPGWSDLLGAQWPATRHAVRAGLAVMLIPVVWRLLDLPSLSQMAITVTAIMAVPSVSNDPAADQQLLVERAMQRLFGCLMRRCGGASLPGGFGREFPALDADADGRGLGMRACAGQHARDRLCGNAGGDGVHFDYGAGQRATHEHPAWHRAICRDHGRAADPAGGAAADGAEHASSRGLDASIVGARRQ